MKIAFTAKKPNYRHEIEKRRMTDALYENAFAIRVIESSYEIFRPGDWLYITPDSIHGVLVEPEPFFSGATLFQTRPDAIVFLRKWVPYCPHKHFKLTCEIVHVNTSPLEGELVTKEC